MKKIEASLLVLAMLSVRHRAAAADPLTVGASAPESESAAAGARSSDDESPLLASAPLPESSAPAQVSAAPAKDESGEAEVVTSGEIAFEARAFRSDHDAVTKDYGVGLFSRLELRADHAPWSFVARGYARADGYDSGRTLVVPERLFVDVKSSWLEARVGVDLFDWSATEAFHPADVINARNFDGQFERYEKIGEPMASLALRWDTGNLTAYYLPYRTFPVLPSRASRLNPFPEGLAVQPFLVIDRDGRPSSDRFAPQGALRLMQKLGTTDVSLHLVHQMDRSEPEILIDPTKGQLTPVLRHVTQVGGTVQTVLEPFIFKLEAAYRSFAQPASDLPFAQFLPKRDHFEFAAGADYGWLWGNAESTLILEYEQFLGANEDTLRALSPFPHDVLLGYRLALSDAGDTVFNASAIADTRQPQQMFFNVSAERRIFAELRANIALRLATGIQEWMTWHIPSHYDHVEVSVARKF